MDRKASMISSPELKFTMPTLGSAMHFNLQLDTASSFDTGDLRDIHGKIDRGGYRTDQIYSPDKGTCLLPWVPDADGSTWCYGSIPADGVAWWRALPTVVAPHDGRLFDGCA
mgnify:CR=1 FL=1